MDRGWKGVLSVVSATAVTLALTAGPAHAATQPGWWSTQGYTVTNSGFNPNEPTLTVSKVPSLKLQRTIAQGQTEVSAPVIDKGRVFVYSAAYVAAYDETTGEQLWRHEQPVGRRDNRSGKMVVTDGKLVVAWNYSEPPGSGASMEVLDAATGKVLVQPQGVLGGVTRMLVDKGVVVISAETRDGLDTIAFSLSDGKVLWTDDNYMSQPVSANGRILVRGHNGNTGPEVSKVIDIRTGKVLFTYPNTFYSALTASPDGSKFYLSWGHSLQTLNSTTGKVTWLASNLYPVYAALSPSRLYVVNQTTVRAINLSNNSIAWTKTYPAATYLRNPIVSGGVLYVPTYYGSLYVFNPVDGAALTTPTFAFALHAPVVTGARLYLSDSTKVSIYGL